MTPTPYALSLVTAGSVRAGSSHVRPDPTEVVAVLGRALRLLREPLTQLALVLMTGGMSLIVAALMTWAG